LPKTSGKAAKKAGKAQKVYHNGDSKEEEEEGGKEELQHLTIYKVLKQVHPELEFLPRAIVHMTLSSMIFSRRSPPSSRLAHYNKALHHSLPGKSRLLSGILLFPGELAKHAVL
ncbi:UNVERIFIED_CONTAM: hypothetical protein GTU68_007298, partial [Idotea baltica]|nr:hypothetical protein [Idotea baltica]